MQKKPRKPLPFDTRHFTRLAENGALPENRQSLFEGIFKRNHWAANATSGAGAEDAQTTVLQRELPRIFQHLGIKSVLDVPCGDFNWMKHLDLSGIDYTGGDIVPDLVEKNQRDFGRDNRRFVHLDLLQAPLPAADLLLCRDVLVHFSFADIQAALTNIRRHPIRYLMTTTFTECPENEDIVTGDWRILNLEKPPFNFPPPLLLLNEQCTEGDGTYGDKCLGVWEVG